jgi:hypothetical protein
MNIFFNFTIFIFLFCLYIIIANYFNKSTFDLQGKNIYFLLELDKFYIRNKLYFCFVLFIYFFFHSLIFLFMRINMLGVAQNLTGSFNLFTYYTIINLILFLLNINLYLQIIYILFSNYLISLHFYLYQKSWYRKLNDLQRDHSDIISAFCLKIALYLYDKIENPSQGLIHKYKIILFLVKYFMEIFNWFHSYLSRFFSYVSFSLLTICFVYDIYHQVLFYIYYALLFHFIARFLHKLRHFLYVKDCVFDYYLSDYFYKNRTSYEDNHKKLLLTLADAAGNPQTFPREVKIILNLQDELKDYIKYDFQVSYIMERNMEENLLLSKARRLNILFLLMLGTIYYFIYYNKYKIIIFESLEIKPLYLLLLLLFLSIIYEILSLYNFNRDKITIIENKSYKFLFFTLSILQIILILYLLLANKILLFPNEILFENDFIKIIEIFSKEEKFAYMEKYFSFILQTQDDLTLWTILKDNILREIRVDNMSMEEVRKVVEAFTNSWLNENINNDLIKVIQNKKKWWKN